MGEDNEVATLSLSDIELGDEIGHGSFGRVYRGRFRGLDVAIKKIVVAQRDLDRHLLSELSLLSSPTMHHHNLIKYYGVAIEPGPSTSQIPSSKEVYIVTEYMDGGDLRSALKSEETAMPWPLRVRIARDIAQALAQMHAADVVHRDIKTENILLDQKWRAVLADYGLSRKAQMGVATAMTLVGTDEFMAPEILWGEAYDERADVFSFGVVCWELLTRRLPGKNGFMTREARSKFKLDFDTLRRELPSDAPSSLINCAVACCGYEPDGRPSSTDIVEWLSDLLKELDPGNACGEGGAVAPPPTPTKRAVTARAAVGSPTGGQALPSSGAGAVPAPPNQR